MTQKLTTTRRDGYYEITTSNRYFQACKDFQGGGWTLREWFGPAGGWSEEDRFETLSECKSEAATRCGLD